MSTEATIYINHSETDSPLETSGIDWVEVNNLEGDRLLINNGSDVIEDGAVAPGESAITGAGLVLDGTEQVLSKYFLLDESDGSTLKEVFNAGAQNKRYVFAVDFDGPTVSIPVLEAWDDIGMDSADSAILGEGTATLSWIQAIKTTSALPGSAWETGIGSGIRLAGASDNHFLELDTEALTVAKTLYFQLKIVVPATQTDAGLLDPILIVKWTTI
jgi:hypothetical protein